MIFQSFTEEFVTYRNLVVDNGFVSVVTGTVQVESMNIHTIFWSLFNLIDGFGFEHREGELKLVDGDLVLTRVGL